MSTFVESLKRLFFNGKITTDKLTELQESGKISAEEYAYITADSGENGDTADLQEFYNAVTQEVGV